MNEKAEEQSSAFLEGVNVNSKWLFGIGIAIGIAASAYSVVQSNLNMVILSIIGVFTLTNALRAQAFRERGMTSESKLMRWLSLFFALAFVVFLIITIVK